MGLIEKALGPDAQTCSPDRALPVSRVLAGDRLTGSFGPVAPAGEMPAEARSAYGSDILRIRRIREEDVSAPVSIACDLAEVVDGTCVKPCQLREIDPDTVLPQEC